MSTTGWLKGLRVTGGGTEVVDTHAGVALVRALSDAVGLTGAGCWPTWRARSPTAARAISDFRVIGDQRELFGGGVPAPPVHSATALGGPTHPRRPYRSSLGQL